MANTFNHNDKVVITDGGNVGIGTTSPQDKLHVTGAVRGDFKLEGGYSSGTTDVAKFTFGYTPRGGDTNNKNIAFISAYNTATDSTSGGYLSIGTRATNGSLSEHIRIAQAGNVGIGTTNPISKLQVNGQFRQLYSRAFISNPLDTDGYAGHIIVNSNNANGDLTGIGLYTNSSYNAAAGLFALQESSTAASMVFYAGSSLATERMRITSTGNVGIGTTSPLAKLDVVGHTYIRGGLLYVDTIAGYSVGAVSLAGSTNFIVPSGNVGIGTTSPDNPLEVFGSNNGIKISSISTDRPHLRFESGTSEHLVLSANSTYGAIGDSTNVNRYMIFNAGNVGIGTTSPSEKLEVTGNVIRVNSDAGGFYQYTSAGVFRSAFYDNGTVTQIYADGNGSTPVMTFNSGNVGIGTTSPSYKLEVDSGSVVVAANFNNTGTTATQVNIGDSGNSQYSNLFLSSNSGQGELFKAGTGYTSYGGALSLNIYNSNGAIAFHPNNTANAMFIATNGNVGIGTTSPDSKFHVEDTNPEVRITGTGGTSFPRLLWEYPVSATQASRWALTGGASANVFYLYNYTQSKKVLQVDGTASHITLNHDAAGTTQIGTSTTQTAYQLYVATNVGQTGAIEAAGSVKITSGALGVNIAASATAGRIDASNDIVAYSTSDYRLKENIKPLENATEKVKKLTGVEFDWKQEHKAVHGYEGHDVGVIAQEVQEVLPEAIRTNDSGYLSVRYEKLIALLVESNKELAARVEELEQKLKQ